MSWADICVFVYVSVSHKVLPWEWHVHVLLLFTYGNQVQSLPLLVFLNEEWKGGQLA